MRVARREIVLPLSRSIVMPDNRPQSCLLEYRKIDMTHSVQLVLVIVAALRHGDYGRRDSQRDT